MEISFYNRNSAKNALLIEVNQTKFYFSYNTLVAVRYIELNNLTRLAVLKNYWKGTTGKHLNWIDGGDHERRLSQEEFDIQAELAMKHAGIDSLPTINII